MKTTRRTFLQLLGFTTVAGAVAPEIKAKLLADKDPNPFAVSYRDEFMDGIKKAGEIRKENLTLTCGYNETEDYTWMKALAKKNGREWHDVIRKNGKSINPEIFAEIVNRNLDKNGFRSGVTVDQVKEVFRGKV